MSSWFNQIIYIYIIIIILFYVDVNIKYNTTKTKNTKKETKKKENKYFIIQEVRRIVFPSLHEARLCETKRYYIWGHHNDPCYIMDIPITEQFRWPLVLKYLKICEELLPMSFYSIIKPLDIEIDENELYCRIKKLQKIIPPRKLAGWGAKKESILQNKNKILNE